MEPITYKNLSFSNSNDDDNLKIFKQEQLKQQPQSQYDNSSDECSSSSSSSSSISSISSSNNSNNNNNNNKNNRNSINNINLNNNINCNYHDLNDLITYCNDCERMICVQCIVSTEHNGHKFTEISKSFSSQLLDKFQKQQFPNLLGYRESDKHVLSALDYCFNEIEQNHKSNLSTIKNEFSKLIQQIQSIELEITSKLESTIQSNQQLKKSIKSQFDQDSKSMDQLINKHQSSIQNYNIDEIYNFETKQYIEIIKDIDKTLPILKRRNNLNNNNNMNGASPTNKISFKNDIIKINNELIDEIKINLNKMIVVENKEFQDKKSKQHLMLNKKIEPYNIEYYLCHGEPIPEGETSVALDSKYAFKFLNVPKSVNRLLLCNGFNKVLKEFKIPDSIKTLRIGDLKQPLEIGGIPNTITELHLCDGFNQILSPGIIPDSIEKLYLYDIKQALSMGSIPSSVKELHLCDGFNQPLAPFIIPDSVQSLSLGEIKHQVLPEFIPSSVLKIRLYNKFNHTIIPQNISESVKVLVLFNTKYPLSKMAPIPSSIKELHICDGYQHEITPFSLENNGNLEKLILCDTKLPLLENSIPNSVKKLILLGYNHPFENNILKDSLNLIYFNNSYTQPINLNLIPNNIEIIKK